MRVDRFTQENGAIGWYYVVSEGREFIEDGHRLSKWEAVLAAEEVYDSSGICKASLI
ncbi:hypothetical protein [Pseudovibrio denitrificans]|nr:hypothetical protein [Pseudovibrio denitrificans]